jgi:phospholipase/carboxylesterase
MLSFVKHVPDGAADGALTIVLLHGRGSDERDLMGLRGALPSDAVVVAPRAPFPGAPWGYGPGWAWYRYIGGATPDPESFEEGQRALAELLEGLQEELPVKPGKVVLGGFSQGGTMSIGYALRNPGAIPMVMNFSGFLPDHPTVAATTRTVEGTDFFWGHGRQDPAIPFALAVAGRRTLEAAGARLEARDYDIGHWISPDEIGDAAGWITLRQER